MDDLFDDESSNGMTGVGSGAARFRALLEAYERSSTSSTKNKPFEALLRQLTGWQSVSFKYVGDAKNIRNRNSEIQNRPDSPEHAFILMPPDLVTAARKEAVKLIRDEKRFDSVGIASDDTRPTFTDFFHGPSVAVPSGFTAEFPAMRVQLVANTSATVNRPRKR